jgi:hypothetical protein
MSNDKLPDSKRMLLTCAFAGMLATAAFSQTPQGPQKSVQPASEPNPAAAGAAAAGVNFNSVPSGRQATTLRRLWGIEDVHIRSTASGSLIRFSYRVVDADKAATLNSKKAAPYLYDEKDSLALQVPVMDQVGQLRQVAAPQNGRTYWMAFSNKGRYLKPGDHVSLIIGNLRIDGLVVE